MLLYIRDTQNCIIKVLSRKNKQFQQSGREENQLRKYTTNKHTEKEVRGSFIFTLVQKKSWNKTNQGSERPLQ